MAVDTSSLNNFQRSLLGALQSVANSANNGGAVPNYKNRITPNGRMENFFNSSGSMLPDASNAGSTQGVFASAPGRQAGTLEHVSGYTGPGYQDNTGRSYTDYGAYLRTDGYFYPEGAKISPNGMYYDTGDGQGWRNAKHAFTSDGRYVPSEAYGASPGGQTPGTSMFNDYFKGGGQLGGGVAGGGTPASTQQTTTGAATTTPDTLPGSNQNATDEELIRFWNSLSQ